LNHGTFVVCNFRVIVISKRVRISQTLQFVY